MEQELVQIRETGAETLERVSDEHELESFRIDYLGRNGQLNSIMKQLGTVAKEDRPRLGQLANTIKKELDSLFKEKRPI